MAKTLHANQIQKLDRPYIQPFYFVHISLAGETLYFSDRCFNYNGHDYEDYLENLSELGASIEEMGGYLNLNAGLVFSNQRFRGYNSLLEFFDANPITRRELEIFVLYKDTGESFGEDVSTKLIRAGIGEIRNIRRLTFEAGLMTVLHLLDSKNPFVQINRTNWPKADPAVIGKYENQVYGFINDCPTHCVKTGAITTLFADVGRTNLTLYLTDVDFPLAFPNTGTIQIDNEKMIYASVNRTNKSIVVARGQSGTTATEHKRGAPVWEVLAEYKYLAMGGKSKSITNVKIDKVRVDTGDYTVNLDEGGKTTITFSEKVITKNQGTHSHGMTGNIITLRPTNSSLTVPSGLWSKTGTGAEVRDQSADTSCRAALSAVESESFAYLDAIFPAWTGAPPSEIYVCVIHSTVFSIGAFATGPGGLYFSVEGGAIATLVPLDGSGHKVTQKILISGPTPPTSLQLQVRNAGGSGSSPSTVGSTIFEVWLEILASTNSNAADGVWGRAQDVIAPLVTCDIEGYQDDVGGTYTGVSGALIENPSDVRRHLLVGILGRSMSEIGSSFGTVRTTCVNRIPGGYKFACVLSKLGDKLSDILRSMDEQSRSQMKEDGGKFELGFNKLENISSVLTVDSDNAEEPVFGFTPQERIKNKIRARYFLDWSGFKEDKRYGEYLNQTERGDAPSILKYGELIDDIAFPAVKIQAMVEDVVDWRLTVQKDVLKTVSIPIDWSARKLERGDFFTLNHSFWDGLKWKVLAVKEMIKGQKFQVDGILYGEDIQVEGSGILADCDDYSQFQTDSAVSGSVVISQESSDVKQGIGALKVQLFRYPKVESHEVWSGAATQFARLGYGATYKNVVQSFQLSAGADIKAVGLPLARVSLPLSDITLAIYDDNANKPGTSLGSTTIAAATPHLYSAASPWGTAPNDFIYGVFSSPITLASGTKYWIVLSILGTLSYSKYYKIKAQLTGTYANGQAGYGAVATTPTLKTWDLNFRICIAGDALNKFIWDVIDPVSLSTYDWLKSWIRSTRTGGFLSTQFGETNPGEQLFPISVSAADTWEEKTIDISAVSAGDRDAITKAGWKITNMDEDAIFRLDYLRGAKEEQ